MVCPHMGRPKSKNPKATQLGVRLNKEQLEKLDAISKHYKETRTDSLRRGIEKLYLDIEKE